MMWRLNDELAPTLFALLDIGIESIVALGIFARWGKRRGDYVSHYFCKGVLPATAFYSIARQHWDGSRALQSIISVM